MSMFTSRVLERKNMGIHKFVEASFILLLFTFIQYDLPSADCGVIIPRYYLQSLVLCNIYRLFTQCNIFSIGINILLISVNLKVKFKST